MPQFKFHGGIRKPGPHASEKFLIFFVHNGAEVPFYSAYENGLVTKVDDELYRTSFSLVKIYAFESIFGKSRRYHSFWMKLRKQSDITTIRPYAGDKSPYYFKARGTLLTSEEVERFLPEDSRRFARAQSPLTLAAVETMIKVKKGAPRIRNILMGKPKQIKKGV